MRLSFLLLVSLAVSTIASDLEGSESRNLGISTMSAGEVRSGASVLPTPADPSASKRRDRIQSATDNLLIKARLKDPFCIPMRGDINGSTEPDHTVALASKKPDLQATAPAKPTFQQAIQNLTIGAINLHTRELLIGAHAVAEGDILLLSNGGERFTAWIESVTQDGAIFRESETGTVATRSLRTGPRLPGSRDTQPSIEDYFGSNSFKDEFGANGTESGAVPPVH